MTYKAKNWGMVIFLMTCYSFSFIDRYVINLLVEPIKRDLGFSDTQISFLLGASFAVFYSLMGIPFGIWADTKNRGKLIAFGIGVWSIATACLSFLKSFPLMFLSRVGVGVGEASLTPSAYSLITDRFDKKEAATALSIYSLGIYIGIAIAYLGGGALIGFLEKKENFTILSTTIYPWQLTFLVVGLPGLILALLSRSIIKEDRIPVSTFSSKTTFSLKILNKKTALALAGFASLSIAVYGSGVWIPAFLQRTFKMPVEMVGQITGVGLVVLPAVGLFLGNYINSLITTRFTKTSSLTSCLVICLLFLPFSGTYGLFNDLTSSLVFLIPYGLTVSAIVGVGAACIQEMAPAGQKGLLTGLYILVQNLIGYGLGPTLIGILTDHFFQDEMQLGKSIFVVCIISVVIACGFFYLSVKPKNESDG